MAMSDVINLDEVRAARAAEDLEAAHERCEAFRFLRLDESDIDTLGTIDDGALVVMMVDGLTGIALTPDLADALADGLREVAAFARSHQAATGVE